MGFCSCFSKVKVVEDNIRNAKSNKKKQNVILQSSFYSLYMKHVVVVGCYCFNKNDGDDSDHHVDFAGGNIQLITGKDMWDEKIAEAKRDGKIVIANFSASWCGPCRMIAPYYRELSETHPSIMFLAIDVDELTEFSTQWDIKATPTFFFLRDGQQFDKLVGANKPELQKKMATILD